MTDPLVRIKELEYRLAAYENPPTKPPPLRDGVVRLKLIVRDGMVQVLPSGNGARRWAMCNVASIRTIFEELKGTRSDDASLQIARRGLRKALEKRWPESDFQIRIFITEKVVHRMCQACVRFSWDKRIKSASEAHAGKPCEPVYDEKTREI